MRRPSRGEIAAAATGATVAVAGAIGYEALSGKTSLTAHCNSGLTTPYYERGVQSGSDFRANVLTARNAHGLIEVKSPGKFGIVSPLVVCKDGVVRAYIGRFGPDKIETIDAAQATAKEYYDYKEGYPPGTPKTTETIDVGKVGVIKEIIVHNRPDHGSAPPGLTSPGSPEVYASVP